MTCAVNFNEFEGGGNKHTACLAPAWDTPPSNKTQKQRPNQSRKIISDCWVKPDFDFARAHQPHVTTIFKTNVTSEILKHCRKTPTSIHVFE